MANQIAIIAIITITLAIIGMSAVIWAFFASVVWLFHKGGLL